MFSKFRKIMIPSISKLVGGTKYDVSLSFRGIDVRPTFISHLHAALLRHKIRTFKDDDERMKGLDIREYIFDGIKQSRISIVTLSPGYASSKWCLDELATIMECKEAKGLLVMPVFHRVEPYEVRYQTGSFMYAFAKLENEFEPEIVQRWRKAMTDVSYLSGFCLSKTRDEAELVGRIIHTVTKCPDLPFWKKRLMRIPVDHFLEGEPNYS